jgi:translation elongation factor EF-4
MATDTVQCSDFSPKSQERQIVYDCSYEAYNGRVIQVIVVQSILTPTHKYLVLIHNLLVLS